MPRGHGQAHGQAEEVMVMAPRSTLPQGGPLPQWCSPAAAAVPPAAVRVEALDEELEVPVGGAVMRRRRAAAAGE
eukprot:scaffold47762_cov39-Phaeocystis_antarctica.AAC.2